MRNLKRVLALALALVMTLSLLVIGSSAASYADADQIDADYTEAIEVLSGLGVFRGQGADDGSAAFAPKAILTRAEASTLVYRILTADVEDKKTDLYDYSSFDDVQEGAWYTGYITYAANGGFVVGDGNGLFRPEDQVTGVQVLAIMLRAIGYGKNGEFVGDAWKDNVLTTANDLGLLKGIATNDLDKGASRELVAQLLFNCISIPEMVSHNILNGYQTTGETLGAKSFKLAAFEGVITANEYADLDNDEPLPANKTIIDGVKYNVSTALTDIGESRRGWAADKDVLFITDTGKNTVWENGGAATELGDNFKKVTGLTDSAEYFLNFGGEYTEWTCEYLLTYGIGEDKAPTVVKAGKSIDIDALKEVFNDNDGYVYLGTSNTDNEEDYSSTMSWSKFKAAYLDGSVKTDAINTTENGEWLKVIDNDGDGEADYVFKTEFAMAKIEAITKKGVYTLTELEDDDKPSIEVTTIDTAKETIVTADELAAGDIVLYTVIDGVYYIDIAEVAVDTIDKKGIDTKNETITCGENVYGQSHIGYAEIKDFDSDITAADTQVSYDLYLDHFGYVRLYTPSAYSKGFVLLTDGYYYTDGRIEEFQATIFDAEAEELADVDVAAGSSKNDTAATTFIDDSDEGWNGSRGTWGRLYPVEFTYFNDFEEIAAYASNDRNEVLSLTNIAAYTADEDGVYTLTKVPNASNKTVYDVVSLNDNELDNDTKLTAKTWIVGEDKIQATNDTVYYLVIRNTKDSDKIDEILTWTGYANAPKDAALADEGTLGYAVTSEGTATYDIAEIMVFETYATTTKDTYFVFDKNTYDVDAIGYDAEEEIYTEVNVELDTKANVAKVDPINFYEITADGVATLIEGDDYAAHHITTGTVRVAQKVSSRDYVVVTDGTEDTFSFKPASTTSYIVKTNGHDVEEQTDAYAIGQKLIIVADKDDNILYIINVSLSVDKNDVVLGDVLDLYNKIADATSDAEIAAALADAKTAAKADLAIDSTAYRAADLAKLPSKADAEKAIDAATTVAEVEKIAADYAAAVAAVPTAAQRDAEDAIVVAAAEIKASLEGTAHDSSTMTAESLAAAAIDGRTGYTAEVTNLVFAADVATYTVTLTSVEFESVTATFDVTAPMA